MRPYIHCAIAGLLAAPSLAACTTIQAIEPVMAPPAVFRSDTLTTVEFMAPVAIGLRCAERGAQVVGLPALNSGACADASLITMLDPCLTLTAGAYARDLCDSLKAERARDLSPAPRAKAGSDPIRIAFPASHRELAQPTRKQETWKVAVSFLAVGALDSRCREGAQSATEPSFSCFRAGAVFAANPCARLEQGWYERLLCHELGHINGWAANHDGGSLRPPLLLASESPEARALELTGGRSAGDEASFAQNAR